MGEGAGDTNIGCGSNVGVEGVGKSSIEGRLWSFMLWGG